MPHELALRDHRALQHAALRTAAAGAGAGLLHALWPTTAAEVLGLLAVGLAAVPPRGARSLATAGLVACVVAAALGLGGSLGLVTAGLAASLYYGRDLEGWPRRLAAVVAGAVAVAAGGFVVEAARLGGALAGYTPALEGFVLGGSAGFLAGLGVVGRELEQVPLLAGRSAVHALASAEAPACRSSSHNVRHEAPLHADLVARVPENESGEIANLTRRASEVARQAHEALGVEGASASMASAGLVERIDRLSRRWSAIEREVARTDRLNLAERLATMGDRANRAGDEIVRAEYLRAERALRQQLEDLDGIARCHDRAVARLHHYVAVLERLRLAALHRRSAEAGNPAAGEDLAPLVEEIAAASLDLDGHAELLELPA